MSSSVGRLFLALALSLGACNVATRDKKVGAGVAVGTALAGAAVYRAASGGCWAQCTHGTVCDPASGTCVEMARAQASSAGSGAVAAHDPEGRWWEKEPPCPPGDHLDDGSLGLEVRALICVASDGVPDGPATFFHGNSRKQSEGWNCRGKPCGVWTHWDEGGAVERVVDFGPPEEE